MTWSYIERYKTVQIEQDAPYYYLIDKELLIPKLGNSQDVLNAYAVEHLISESFEFIEQYPLLNKQQVKLLFPDATILGVELEIVKDRAIEPPKPTLVVINMPDRF